MPRVIINEKDLSVFNIYLDNDNIVWIPGFSITGPYEAPRLLNSHSDLASIFGDRPPAESYPTSATINTYKLCTGWDFAAQMLRKGFRVLFQRIVPYKYDDVNHELTYDVDDEKLVSSASEITQNTLETTTTYTYTEVEAGGEPVEGTQYYTADTEHPGQYNEVEIPANPIPSDPKYYTRSESTVTTPVADFVIGFKEKYGGTFGNRLAIIFTVNVNVNKLYYKLIDTRTLEVLEYVEICEAKFNSTTGIDAKYLLKFAKGFCEAIGSSKYIELETGEKNLSDVASFNAYIINTLTSTTGTFENDSAETGEIKYIRNPELDPSVPDDISISAEHPNYLIDEVLVNPKYGTGTGVLTKTAVRSNIVLGDDKVTTGEGNEVILPETENENVVVAGVMGKDYTINDALDTTTDPDAFVILADTITRGLDNIKDKILFDVKYVTLGNIYTTSYLINSNGTSVYNACADLCAFRGDCVAILNPDYRKESVNVKQDFKSIGGKPSSYASVFAPWAVMSIYNGDRQWCSPAMVFLTALAESVENGNPVYLPPAGVNRASLPDVYKTEYMIGSTLLDTWQNRDVPTNINPVMFLNNYGYVIFGQRTLYDTSDQLVGTRSALQELGVRLVVLECKKEIRRVAIGLLFEYNNVHTWNEFKAGLRPMFSEMLDNGALQEYQIIMDETTNDADDIDNNTLRGVIKIVPGRAVEDVIISFELYRSGVTFADEEPNN